MELRATDLIPHRPPMLFIDTVRRDGDDVTASVTVRPDWMILDGEGCVSGPAWFEIMAQGFACIAALRARELPETERTTVNLGFLVGVKKFEISGRARAGDVITVSTANHTEIGPFNIFEAVARNADGGIMAKGQIKVFLADEEAMREGGFEDMAV